MIKVVLFDLGNTLLYFDSSWPQVFAQAYNSLLASLVDQGYVLDERHFLEDFSARINDYYAQREAEFIEYTTGYILKTMLYDYGYRDVPAGHIRSALDALYAITQSHWVPEEDAIPTLEELSRRGYRLGIISNAADASDVDALLDKGRLHSYFEQVWISANVGYRKPHPRIFKQAVDYFQVAPQEMAMVGDTLGADILGANQAGMHSIWVTRRADTPGNRDHLDTIRPEAQAGALAEIPPILERW
jgi:putative hydrolase of the HAD superfamily